MLTVARQEVGTPGKQTPNLEMYNQMPVEKLKIQVEFQRSARGDCK